MDDKLFFYQIIFLLLHQWLQIVIRKRSISIVDLEGTVPARDFMSWMTCVSRIDKLDRSWKRLVMWYPCLQLFERILLFGYLQRVLKELTV